MEHKTIEQIQKEVAAECGETYFGVQLSAEISVGNYMLARNLMDEVSKRYISQFMEGEDSVDRWDECCLRDLKRGDIVKHKGGSDTQYVVTANYGGRVTAVATVDITNEIEWQTYNNPVR